MDVIKSYVGYVENKHMRQSISKELEIKFYITPDQFDTLYNSILPGSTGVIEQVLNTVTDVASLGRRPNIQVTERREILYKAGVKHSEKDVRKSKEHFKTSTVGSLRYQIAFATETAIKTFSVETASSIRLKLRSSILHKDFPDWRFDFTLVKTVDRARFSQIKTIISQYFTKTTTVKNFAANRSLEHDITAEFEVEYIGSGEPDLIESQMKKIINFIQAGIDPVGAEGYQLQQALGAVAELLLTDKAFAKSFYTKNTLKQLANQPKIFDYQAYRNVILPMIDDFYLSDKADGDRCFMVVDVNKQEINYISTAALIQDTGKIKWDLIPLLDAMIIMDVERLETGVNMAFDLMWCGENLTALNFGERLAKLGEVVDRLAKANVPIELKPQVKLTKLYATEILQLYENKARAYPIDGLIFTPDKGYGILGAKPTYKKHIHYFDMTVYKWKPPDRQTIDFLCMKAPASVLGIDPYEVRKGFVLMFLFCGVSFSQFKQLGLVEPRGYQEIFTGWNLSSQYFPAAFMPSSNPTAYMWYCPEDQADAVNGHVVELAWSGSSDQASKGWSLYKIRTDRDDQVRRGIGYGNAWRTAELTYDGYSDPFTLERLLAPNTDEVYFAKGKSERYKPMTRFNAYVKAQLIRQLEGSDLVIDLAAGKGQDLFTIHGYGIKNVLFVDRDKEALVELNSRKYNLNDKKWYMFGFKPNKSMNIMTADVDLTLGSPEIIERLSIHPVKQATADGMIMNFAIHYIIHDETSRDNLVDLVDYYLKPGGLFIFTCFDGKRVFDFLKTTKTGKSLDIYDPEDVEPDQIKYSIRKDYTDKEFKPTGLKVGVVHPFSDGEYYVETLLGIEWILSEFQTRGYTVFQNSSFGDWLERYKSFDKKIPMSEQDKIYVSLYSYCTVAKPVSATRN